jgi:hypothetical protein
MQWGVKMEIQAPCRRVTVAKDIRVNVLSQHFAKDGSSSSLSCSRVSTTYLAGGVAAGTAAAHTTWAIQRYGLAQAWSRTGMVKKRGQEGIIHCTIGSTEIMGRIVTFLGYMGGEDSKRWVHKRRGG